MNQQVVPINDTIDFICSLAIELGILPNASTILDINRNVHLFYTQLYTYLPTLLLISDLVSARKKPKNVLGKAHNSIALKFQEKQLHLLKITLVTK